MVKHWSYEVRINPSISVFNLGLLSHYWFLLRLTSSLSSLTKYWLWSYFSLYFILSMFHRFVFMLCFSSVFLVQCFGLVCFSFVFHCHLLYRQTCFVSFHVTFTEWKLFLFNRNYTVFWLSTSEMASHFWKKEIFCYLVYGFNILIFLSFVTVLICILQSLHNHFYTQLHI